MPKVPGDHAGVVWLAHLGYLQNHLFPQPDLVSGLKIERAHLLHGDIFRKIAGSHGEMVLLIGFDHALPGEKVTWRPQSPWWPSPWMP